MKYNTIIIASIADEAHEAWGNNICDSELHQQTQYLLKHIISGDIIDIKW